MREINFRAFDKIMPHMIYDLNDGDSNWDNYYKNPRYEFMQFTGIKDKNGKEVYEGDIIEITYKGLKCYSKIIWKESTIRYDDEKNKYQLNGYIDKGGWDQELIKGKTSLALFENNYEVIGNIYENSNLINN
jgi:uncharacterized phage protein (TIGR01671 family)